MFGSQIVQDAKELTVGIVCADALMQDYSSEKLSFEQKTDRAELAQKFLVPGSTAMELSNAEWDKLKVVLAGRFSPLVCKQVMDAIDFSPAK